MTPPAARDGWAQHEEQQRQLWLKLTPDERLAWLEDTRRWAIKYLGSVQKRATPARPDR